MVKHKLAPSSEREFPADISPHEGDCDGSLCPKCGCCTHCLPKGCGCEYTAAGGECPDRECMCGKPLTEE